MAANGSNDAPSRPTPPSLTDAPKAPDQINDPGDYGQLSPADKVVFRTAKLSYAQAYAKFTAAKADAVKAFNKPFDDYLAAKKPYDAAVDACQASVTAAEGRRKEMVEVVNDLDADELKDPAKAAIQLKLLQDSVDAYKKAASDVAAASATVETQKAALAKLAEGPDDLLTPNALTQHLAEEQYALDVAQALAVLDAAHDQFRKAEVLGRGRVTVDVD